MLPRVMFGDMNSTSEEIAAQVPDGFDPKAFHTLRYRKHEPKQARRPGKSIVDVSRYDGRRIDNPHDTMTNACSSGAFVDYADAILRVHHYTGSLELYLSRAEDARRSEEGFKSRNRDVTGSLTDDTLRGWLKAFVDMVGNDKALEATARLRQWAIADDARASAEMEREKDNFRYPYFEPL